MLSVGEEALSAPKTWIVCETEDGGNDPDVQPEESLRP